MLRLRQVKYSLCEWSVISHFYSPRFSPSMPSVFNPLNFSQIISLINVSNIPLVFLSMPERPTVVVTFDPEGLLTSSLLPSITLGPNPHPRSPSIQVPYLDIGNQFLTWDGSTSVRSPSLELMEWREVESGPWGIRLGLAFGLLCPWKIGKTRWRVLPLVSHIFICHIQRYLYIFIYGGCIYMYMYVCVFHVDYMNIFIHICRYMVSHWYSLLLYTELSRFLIFYEKILKLIRIIT